MTLSYAIRSVLLAFAIGVFSPADAAAQGSPTPASDSLFRKAKRLVAEGNGVAGRALVDSILRASSEGTPPYGDALYWRGALAETAADAERDYRRVIVEYPLSTYADHALLGIADLETARGDRAAALQHLQRFVKDHPVSSTLRGSAALSAARLAFEQRDVRIGCAMVSAARASTPPENVEVRNQIDYLGNRCTGQEVAAVPVQQAPSSTSSSPPPANASVSKTTANPKPVARDTAPRPIPRAVTPPPPRVDTVIKREAASATVPERKGNYTIQLAAYNTKADANALVAKLKAKGIAARVSGEAKPFRVRLDFYPTRQAAQAEVDALRARGIIGFVTTESPSTTP